MLLFPGRSCKLDDAGNKMFVSISTKADANSGRWGLHGEAAQPWLECYHRGAVMDDKAPPSDPSSSWGCSASSWECTQHDISEGSLILLPWNYNCKNTTATLNYPGGAKLLAGTDLSISLQLTQYKAEVQYMLQGLKRTWQGHTWKRSQIPDFRCRLRY